MSPILAHYLQGGKAETENALLLNFLTGSEGIGYLITKRHIDACISCLSFSQVEPYFILILPFSKGSQLTIFSIPLEKHNQFRSAFKF